MNKLYDRKLRGRHCQCPTCCEYFNSPTAFDLHRVGDWQDRGANRRCLTPVEMAARGWSLNPAGFWITETVAQRAARAPAESAISGDVVEVRGRVAGQGGSPVLDRVPKD